MRKKTKRQMKIQKNEVSNLQAFIKGVTKSFSKMIKGSASINALYACSKCHTGRDLKGTDLECGCAQISGSFGLGIGSFAEGHTHITYTRTWEWWTSRGKDVGRDE